MRFSRERARAEAIAKYVKETDRICGLLKAKDIQGIKVYLDYFATQKKRYASCSRHWTRSGAITSLIADMQALCATQAC